MFLIILVVIVPVVMIVALPRMRRKRLGPDASPPGHVRGPAPSGPNGDAMNTSISPALDAADLLALARLDDEGAPPAVNPPRSAEGQRSHAIRATRTGQPAAIQAEATGPERGQGARQAAPAGLGVG